VKYAILTRQFLENTGWAAIRDESRVTAAAFLAGGTYEWRAQRTPADFHDRDQQNGCVQVLLNVRQL